MEVSEALIDEFLESEKKFIYLYDFGDYWGHQVVLEKTIQNYECNYPVVAKFKGETPYEDCGGIAGYYDLLEILENPENSRYREMKNWVENHFTEKYDIEKVNEKLKKLALENTLRQPMNQNEIYQDVIEGKKGFFTIQGKQMSELFESDMDETDLDIYDNEELENLDNMLQKLQDMEVFLKDQEKKIADMMQSRSYEELLMNLTKESLCNIAKVHHLKGYSKYSKKGMVDFLKGKLLSEDVMNHFFLYLSDRALELLEGDGRPVFDTSDLDILHEGGYAFGDMTDHVFTPEEVREAFRKNCGAKWKQEREGVQELCCYVNGAVDLYGICSVSKVQEIYKNHTGKVIPEAEWMEFCETMPECKQQFHLSGDELVHIDIDPPEVRELQEFGKNKEFYMPSREEIMCLGDRQYLPFDKYLNRLLRYLEEEQEVVHEEAQETCEMIQYIIRMMGSFEEVLNYLENEILLSSKEEAEATINMLTDIWNHTRMISNRGFMPVGLSSSSPAAEKAKILNFPSGDKKIYPNDPCPCGSGKKYKHCCGKKK